jgi:hypothetical protein
MNTESLTIPGVTGKDENSVYEETWEVSADFVKNFTSDKKALATTCLVGFQFPLQFSSFSDDSHGTFSFLHRKRRTRRRVTGFSQGFLS